MVIDKIDRLYKYKPTPFYCYDIAEVIRSIEHLKSALPERVHLFYSIKANPNHKIIATMIRNGLGVEVSSIGELQLALKIGCSPDHIIFSGPGKTKEALRLAVETRIKCIHVETFLEIQYIENISCACNIRTDISLRINPLQNVSKSGIKMTGLSSQFGFDEESLQFALNEMHRFQHIRLIGIHIYHGTQILNYEDIIAHTRVTLDYIERIEQHGYTITYVNMGGGFGVPYFISDHELNLTALKEALDKLFDEYKGSLSDKQIVYESGRFLVATAGCFITKILYKKNSYGKIYLICDGGSNFHVNTAFLGRRVRDNFPVSVIQQHTKNEKEVVTITGPLCTPTDILAQDVNLPICQEGDYIVVEKSGAYGLTNSPILFISHPKAREIVVATARK